MTKVAFYSPLFVTGGMETAVLNLISLLELRGNYEFYILYDQYNQKSYDILCRLSQVAEVRQLGKTDVPLKRVHIKPKTPPLEVDVLVNCSNWKHKVPSVKAKKVLHWIHGTGIANDDKFPMGEPVIVQSQWQLEKILSTSKVLCFARHILPNVVDELSIHFDSQRVYTDAPAPKTYYLMACRISPEKGWNRLLDFMNLHCNVEKRVLILGEPYNDEGETIQANMKALLGPRISFLGNKPNPYPYIRDAEYVLVLSDFETYGMVSKEAHIVGTPVVFNRFPTAELQFEEGVDQWLDEFEPKSSIPFFYADEEQERTLQCWEELLHAD